MEQKKLNKIIADPYYYQNNMSDIIDALRDAHFKEGIPPAEFAKLLGFSCNSTQRLLLRKPNKTSFARMTHLIKFLLERGY